MVDRVGQQIGHYHLLHLLGAGGFAHVYLGEQVWSKTEVAVKIFHERIFSEDQRDKVYTEARILESLIHPNIVRILDFGIEANTTLLYLVMTYAPNGTLRDRHPKGSLVPLDKIGTYVSQIAEALQYAHERNIVHGDVKPENMLVEEKDKILLGDFGTAFVNDSMSTPVEPAGTLTYVAPECLEGKSVPASDQYSLGVVVYEWLSGSPPFAGGPSQVMFQHIGAPPPSLAERSPFISKGLEQVVMKALSKHPAQRYPTVKEFANALEEERRATTMAQEPPRNPEEKPFLASPVPYSPPHEVTAPYPRIPTIPPENLSQEIYGKLQVLPAKEQKEILIKAMGALSSKDKNEIVQVVGVRPLTQEATDFIWKVVVSGAVAVFVGSALGIGVAVFVGVNVAPLITVFTAVRAFLGGLLAPSPVQNAVRSLSSGFKSSSKTQDE